MRQPRLAAADTVLAACAVDDRTLDLEHRHEIINPQKIGARRICNLSHISSLHQII